MKKNYITKLKSAIAVIALIGFQQIAVAQTATVKIDVSEDTYVTEQGDNSGTNYGSDVEARVRDTATSAPRIAFFKFPVAASLPVAVTSAKITFATYLPSSSDKTEIIQIHKLVNTWSENVVVFDDKPNTGAFITELEINSVQVSSPNDYTNTYTADVTSYFNQMLAAGATNISFAFKAKNKDDFRDQSGLGLGEGQGGNVRLGTKEASAGASLEVTYSTLSTDFFTLDEEALSVYPNPIQSSFTLSKTFEFSDDLEVSIFNILGAKVANFKESVEAGKWKKDLSAKEFKMSKGMYLLKVSSKNNGTSVSKLVVE